MGVGVPGRFRARGAGGVGSRSRHRAGMDSLGDAYRDWRWTDWLHGHFDPDDESERLMIRRIGLFLLFTVVGAAVFYLPIKFFVEEPPPERTRRAAVVSLLPGLV